MEPGSASLLLYGLLSLSRGPAGARRLTRTLHRDREAVGGVVLEEVADALCSHPELILTAVLLLRCLQCDHNLRYLAGAPGLLHLLRGPHRLLQEEPAPPALPGLHPPVRGGPVPAHAPRLPALLRARRPRAGAGVHPVRQLAEAGLPGEGPEAVPPPGPADPVHAGAGQDPDAGPAVHPEAAQVAEGRGRLGHADAEAADARARPGDAGRPARGLPGAGADPGGAGPGVVGLQREERVLRPPPDGQAGPAGRQKRWTVA